MAACQKMNRNRPDNVTPQVGFVLKSAKVCRNALAATWEAGFRILLNTEGNGGTATLTRITTLATPYVTMAPRGGAVLSTAKPGVRGIGYAHRILGADWFGAGAVFSATWHCRGEKRSFSRVRVSGDAGDDCPFYGDFRDDFDY